MNERGRIEVLDVTHSIHMPSREGGKNNMTSSNVQVPKWTKRLSKLTWPGILNPGLVLVQHKTLTSLMTPSNPWLLSRMMLRVRRMSFSATFLEGGINIIAAGGEGCRIDKVKISPNSLKFFANFRQTVKTVLLSFY